MTAWKFYMRDMAPTYSTITAQTNIQGAANCVNGFPSSIASITSTSALLTLSYSSSIQVAGFAIYNHTLNGARIQLYRGSTPVGALQTLGTTDFLYDANDSTASTTWSLNFSNTTSGMRFGVASFLWNRITLTNTGVYAPLPRRIIPYNSTMSTPTGVTVTQVHGGPSEELELHLNNTQLNDTNAEGLFDDWILNETTLMQGFPAPIWMVDDNSVARYVTIVGGLETPIKSGSANGPLSDMILRVRTVPKQGLL